jgi:hypothetical protein
MNTTKIELNRETCIELLKKYIDSGYKSTGVISIKDGAVLHKYFRVLKNQEKSNEETVKESEIFKIIFKIIDVLNTNRAFTLDDAAVIDTVITFVEENILKEVSKGETVVDPEQIKK